MLPYVLLPEKQLTQAQYNILTKWLDFVLNANGEINVQAQKAFSGANKIFKTSQGI